jgi:cytochrome c2
MLAASASAENGETFDRGQALYENHCTSCHDVTVHTRDKRRAASVEDLRQFVLTWSFHGGLDWTSEEVDDVVDSINRRFYGFTVQP